MGSFAIYIFYVSGLTNLTAILAVTALDTCKHIKRSYYQKTGIFRLCRVDKDKKNKKAPSKKGMKYAANSPETQVEGKM